MSKESTHSLMGQVVYAPGVLITASMPPRKGKTSVDHKSGAHARTVENRNACRFRSASTDCKDCPCKSHQGDTGRRR